MPAPSPQIGRTDQALRGALAVETAFVALCFDQVAKLTFCPFDVPGCRTWLLFSLTNLCLISDETYAITLGEERGRLKSGCRNVPYWDVGICLTQIH